jgi:predicted PurR-regulated permease PerM/methylmalonyl-CoA mutase cobalamin-binding subunit
MLPVTKIPPVVGSEAHEPGMQIRSVASGLLAAAVVVGFLYYGRDVLIPFALTTLISFALGPMVSWFRRYVGLRLAVALTVLLAVCVVGGVTFLLAWQITDLAANLPKYRSNLNEKMEALRGGGGLIAHAVGSVRELFQEMTRVQGAPEAPPAPMPMPVKIEDSTALDIVASFLMPVVLPLLTLGLVVVLVIFMLLEREPLRDRVIRLISRGDISRTTDALNDAVERLSRFLATQVLINVGFGAVIAAGLWLIGMPNPLVWGLLGTVLRFVPYAGSLITTVLPTLVAIAVSPGWTMPILTICLILGCEVIVGQVIEPLGYGNSTGMSPLAVLVSTICWAALWGPIGLVLAMPITVCLIVIGRHVPQLEFLGVVLGDEPVLSTEAQIYHRLLARSPYDAVEIAADRAEEKGALPLYDDVVMPMLVQAENDRRRGAIDSEQQQLLQAGIDEIILAVTDEPDVVKAEGAAQDVAASSAPPAEAAAAHAAGRVLCVGGRSSLDRAAAALLVDVLRRRGIAAQACTIGELSGVLAQDTPDSRPRAIALCVLAPGSATVVQHLVRRIRQRCPPDTPLVIGGFGPEIAPSGSRLADMESGAITITRALDSLGDTIGTIVGRPAAAA